MNEQIIPPELLTIFNDVHEAGDRVLAILPEVGAAPDLAQRATEISAAEFPDHGVSPTCEAVICLDVLSRQATAEVSHFVQRVSALVRPGGLLFLTARSVDHPAWKSPEPRWEHSDSRGLHCSDTGENRFFLYDDEVITLFAAWNVLHHREGEDGWVEAVLIKPEGRLVDVSTVLYEG